MNAPESNQPGAGLHLRVAAVVFLTLAIQIVSYYRGQGLVLGGQFRLLHVLLRIVLPLLIVLVWLRIPLRELGLCWPRATAKEWAGIVVGSLVICGAVALFVRGQTQYAAHYLGAFGSAEERLSYFSLFTLSTLPGWEFLHRGFLLFGVWWLLEKEGAVPRRTAQLVALLLVLCCESLFHLLKPEAEALGMLLASPLLSLIALRTGSILLPFLIHLGVEMAFFFSLPVPW